VNQSQEKTATTEVQPHQFNATPTSSGKRLNRCYQLFHATPTSSGKRLNRCYQFNATVLVLFLLWGPIILMQKIYIYINGSFLPPLPPPQGDLSIQVKDVEKMAIINS
jgi:hypothetical protein